MSGTIIAQAIPILVSPILSRLYTPAEFGILAIFLSIVQIFGSVANGRYELAIVIPKRNSEALILSMTGMFISLLLSLFLLFIILIFHDSILNLLGSIELSKLIFFAPLSIFMIGVFNILNYYNTRKKNYSIIAKANVYKAIGNVGVQLSLGFLNFGPGGLILGNVSSNLSGNTKLFSEYFKERRILKKVSLRGMLRVAKKYQDFPKFSVWGIFLNTLSQNLMNIIISIMYAVSSVGYYSFAFRYLAMPTTLIGNSIGQVFIQKASESRQKYGNAKQIFNATLKKLLYIGIPTFLIAFIFVEDVFAFVFGENWRIAGVYAQIVIPLIFMRFITAPLSLINIVFEKQKLALMWQFGLFVLTIGSAGIIYLLNYKIEVLLIVQTIILSLYYLFLIFIVNRVSKGEL